MKLIIYYDPKKKELLDIPWDEDRPIPPLIKPKIKKKKGRKKNRTS